jgi:hypothetical protein
MLLPVLTTTDYQTGRDARVLNHDGSQTGRKRWLRLFSGSSGSTTSSSGF